MKWLPSLQRAGNSLAGHASRYMLMGVVLSVAVGSFGFVLSIQSSLGRAIAAMNIMDGGPHSVGIYPDLASGKALTLKDLHAVEQALSGRARVNAYPLSGAVTALDGGPQKCGVFASVYPQMDPSNVLESGRWISEEDERDARLVGVANPALLKLLSADPRTALGKAITLNGLTFTIIGTDDVLPSLRTVLGRTRIAVLTIPYSTLQARFKRSSELGGILISVPRDVPLEEAAGKAVMALRKNRGLAAASRNPFLVVSSKDRRAYFSQVTLPMRLAAWLVTVVSALLALSIGWYLFALLAQQRKGEIGIQRALGATREQVLQAYAVEVAILLTASIVLGVLASWVTAWVVRAHFANHNTDYSIDWKLFIGISLNDVLITFITWAAVGASMALVPVRKMLKKPLPELLR
ncbi:MAG: ABC transporter permease [Acidobacteriota bacterium]